MIELDKELLLLINGAHNAFWDQVMYAYSGKLVWIPMYFSIFYIMYQKLSNWKTLLYCLVAVALTILFADQMCSHLIRPYFMRLRPSNLENPLSAFVHIVNDYRGGSYGFPSCHAANTFALATFVALLFKKRALTLFMMAWALVTCYSRSYLGVHYPGDLLVGGMVGACGAWLMYTLFLRVSGYKETQKGKQLYAPILLGGITVAGILLYAAMLTW